MTPLLALALVCVALVAGVGITTVGPGGVFVTAALYGLTDLSSATVAGTASATFVATGLVGSATYVRSGELRSRDAGGAAAVLSASSVVGALAGTRANLLLPDRLFGYALAAFLAGFAVVLAYREGVGIEPGGLLRDGRRWHALTGVGTGVGFLGGMLGVGGPVVAIPVLVALGMPMLRAVAVAQVQSVFLSLFAALGYFAVGAVDATVAVLVGVPQLLGVVAGWRLAHAVEPHRLRLALSVVLVATAGVVAFQS